MGGIIYVSDKNDSSPTMSVAVCWPPGVRHAGVVDQDSQKNDSLMSRMIPVPQCPLRVVAP